MKHINLKFKIIIMFLLLFLVTPLSVSAGILDGGSTGDGVEKTDKNVIDSDLDHLSVKNRLVEYTSFISDGAFGGSGAYSALAQPDENSINGYAKLVDTTTGGRAAVRQNSEVIENYQGFYYYDIKITVAGEVDWNGVAYSRRTYYKYIQLKKENRTFNSTNYSFGGASTGIWLYYSNDQVVDKETSYQTDLQLIDVFTGTSLGADMIPYWDQMFMWPVSSKGVGERFGMNI